MIEIVKRWVVVAWVCGEPVVSPGTDTDKDYMERKAENWRKQYAARNENVIVTVQEVAFEKPEG